MSINVPVKRVPALDGLATEFSAVIGIIDYRTPEDIKALKDSLLANMNAAFFEELRERALELKGPPWHPTIQAEP